MVALPIHYRPSFRLPHALAVSLLLHVVLWIILSLGGWTPRTNLTVMEPPQKDDDSELTFTFADEVSEVEGRRQGLIPTEEVFDGDLPIPEPSLVPRSGAPSAPSEQQATTPTQQTAPSRQAPSESPSTETPPTPPQPKEQTEEIVGIEREEAPDTPTEEPVEEFDQPEEVLDPIFQEDAGELPIQERFDPPRQQESQPQPIQPSLDDRLTDFGRAVDRYREANPPESQGAPTNNFKPDWSALPQTGQRLGNLQFESTDFDWTDYSRQIYFIIWRTWHNRLLNRVDDFEKWAQQNQEYLLRHLNVVHFTIESNGEISQIILESESGCVPFDFSATEALDEAVLPPLPEGFPRDRENVRATFIGEGPIQTMRRTLQYYKRAGFF